jgi:hypothetical protein
MEWARPTADVCARVREAFAAALAEVFPINEMSGIHRRLSAQVGCFNPLAFETAGAE